MKRLRVGWLVAALLFCAAAGVAPGQAQVPYQVPPGLKPLRPCEEEVLRQVAAGEVADLEKAFGKEEGPREIRAKFFEALLANEFVGLKIGRHGIYLKNAIIGRGDAVNLRGAEFPFEVRLVHCVIKANLNLQDSRFEHSLQIINSDFRGEAYFLGMEVAKNALFNGTTFRDLVNCRWAKIGNEFSLIQAHLLVPYLSYFDGLVVGQNILCEYAEFAGSITFDNVNVGQNLDFLEAKVHGAASLRSIRVGGSIHLENATFNNGVYLSDSVVARSLRAVKTQFLDGVNYASFPGLKVGKVGEFQEAVFKGPVDFDGAEFGLELNCNQARFEHVPAADKAGGLSATGLKVGSIATFQDAIFAGPVNFAEASIGGQFNAAGAKFETPETVVFTGLQVGSLAQFVTATFKGPVSFKGARIGGRAFQAEVKEGAVLEGVGFQKEVLLDEAHFYNLYIIGPTEHHPHIQRLTLERAEVTGRLDMENLTVDELQAANLVVRGETIWKDMNLGRADLSNASFTSLYLDNVIWPAAAGTMNLSGATYQYLDMHTQPSGGWLTRVHSRFFPHDPVLDWVESSSFDSRNYSQLQAYYKRIGKEDLADQAYISQKRRERNLGGAWWNPRTWFETLFWDLPVGYGKKPLRIIWFAIPFIVLGAIFFDPADIKDVEWPNKGRWHRLGGKMLLSLDLFTPSLLNLGMEKYWVCPESRRMQVFLFCHKLAGKIFLAVFFLGIWAKFK